MVRNKLCANEAANYTIHIDKVRAVFVKLPEEKLSKKIRPDAIL